MGSFTYGQSKHELFESELNCMHVSESVKSDSIYKMMNNDTLSDYVFVEEIKASHTTCIKLFKNAQLLLSDF